MSTVASYAAVRRFVFVDGHSRREAARMVGLYRETVARNSRFSLPPVCTRKEPTAASGNGRVAISAVAPSKLC